MIRYRWLGLAGFFQAVAVFGMDINTTGDFVVLTTTFMSMCLTFAGWMKLEGWLRD